MTSRQAEGIPGPHLVMDCDRYNSTTEPIIGNDRITLPRESADMVDLFKRA